MTMTQRFRLGVAVALLLVPGPALAQSGLTAVRVPGTGPPVEPDAPLWARVPSVRVAMLPQVVTTPQKPDAAVKELRVKAVHNGVWIGFLLEWRDPSRSDVIRLDEFGDQVAVQLPVSVKDGAPSPMMGNPGGRVNIMQWRAAFQRDIDHGPPGVRDLYPNSWVDVYPDEILGLADARPYSGALGLENPVSRGVASPVLDQMAEGWGSMTAKPDQRAVGKGVWKNGVWKVTIARPLASDDPNAPLLTPGVRTAVGFAVWEGGSAEVGARKSWAPWMQLRLQK